MQSMTIINHNHQLTARHTCCTVNLRFDISDSRSSRWKFTYASSCRKPDIHRAPKRATINTSVEDFRSRAIKHTQCSVSLYALLDSHGMISDGSSAECDLLWFLEEHLLEARQLAVDIASAQFHARAVPCDGSMPSGLEHRQVPASRAC